MRFLKSLSWEMFVRIAADTVLVNVALVAAFAFRLIGLLWLQGSGGDVSVSFFTDILDTSITGYFSAAPVLTLLCLVVFYLSGFYTYGRAYQGRYKALVIFQAVTLAYLAFGAITYLFLSVVAWFPRSTWLTGWFLTVVLLEGVRFWSSLWRATVLAESKILGKPQTQVIRDVTVFGGAGYIGSVLVRKLLDQGYRVTVLDALLYGDESIRDLYGRQGFELICGDVRNVESVVQALQGANAVVHLGALVGDPACAVDEKLTLEINLAATRMIAEAARGFGVQRFIFASTCSVYGASEQTLDERSVLNPVSLYARTKIESEQILLGLNDDHFAPVILRFATIYGLSPRPRFDLVVNVLAAKATCEKAVTIFGGEQWRPFIHVADVAEAVLRSLEAPLSTVKGQTFNVGADEQNYRIAELGDIIKNLVPDVHVTRKDEEVDQRNYRVSFAKIRSHLDFTLRRSVTDGVLEIKAAIESGAIPNYRDSRYNNHSTLSEAGSAHLVRHTRMTSLYTNGIEEIIQSGAAVET